MRRRLAVIAAVPLLLAGCAAAADEAAPTPSAASPSVSASAEPEPEVESTAVVPEVVGMAVEDAVAEVERAGATASINLRGDAVALADVKGALVVDTYPAEGDEIRSTGNVSLFVSAPPSAVELPDHAYVRDGSVMTIEVDRAVTLAEAEALVVAYYSLTLPDDMYVVLINCATGGTAAADNRLANARLSVGSRGEQISGLEDGTIDVELVEGARCP